MTDEFDQSSFCLRLVHFLIARKVTHYVFSPGARNSPLTLALLSEALRREKSAKSPISVYSHFDERGAGFFSLGLARSLPLEHATIALITTSGSAVANLLPALVEANYQGRSLLLITADRPPELHEIQSNQTIEQNILKSQLAYFLHLDPLVHRVNRCHGVLEEVKLQQIDPLLSRVSYALGFLSQLSQAEGGGSVQINLVFREPLVSSRSPESGNEVSNMTSSNLTAEKNRYCSTPVVSSANSVVWERHRGVVGLETSKVLEIMEQLVTRSKKTGSSVVRGIMVVGELDQRLDRKVVMEVVQFFDRRGWLILVDLLSGLPGGGNSSRGEGNYLLYSELLFKYAVQDKNFLKRITTVIHLGGRLISKWLVKWLERSSVDYLQVDHQVKRYDPAQVISKHLLAPVDLFCRQILALETELKNLLGDDKNILWPRRLNQKLWELHQTYRNDPDFLLEKSGGEWRLAHQLHTFFQAQLDQGHEMVLFLGNSMPIRDFAGGVYFKGNKSCFSTYANRGASGIDGLVATAIGIALGHPENQARCYAILGDLSFLHDLNSLSLLAHLTTKQMTFILINNQEGTIFNFIDLFQSISARFSNSPSNRSSEKIKNQLLYRHEYIFKSLADFFSLEYSFVEDDATLAESLKLQQKSARHHLMEVKINAQTNFEEHQKFEQWFQKEMKSFLSESIN